MYYYSLLLLLFTMVSWSVYAESFFKQASNWLFGTQQQHLVQELPCNPLGTIVVENISGSITVEGWALDRIALETIKEAPSYEMSNLSIGVTTRPDLIRVVTQYTEQDPLCQVSYRLMIPRTAHIVTKTNSGLIRIKGCGGAIEAFSGDGTIDIQQASGTVTVTASGQVAVNFCSTLGADSSIISTQADIIVTLPPKAGLTLYADTHQGFITTQQKVRLDPCIMQLCKESWRIATKHVRGIIGTGGTKLVLRAFKGIKILEQ